MFPFIHVGSLNIGTYGLCILIGAVAGIGGGTDPGKAQEFFRWRIPYSFPFSP